MEDIQMKAQFFRGSRFIIPTSGIGIQLITIFYNHCKSRLMFQICLYQNSKNAKHRLLFQHLNLAKSDLLKSVKESFKSQVFIKDQYLCKFLNVI